MGRCELEHSLAYCRRDHLFMPAVEWEQKRHRYYRHLGLPPTLRRYAAPLLATLVGALEEVAEAVRAGAIVIENGQLHLPALVAEATPVGLRHTQERLFEQIGTVQLPELIMEMDSQIRFSWTLLGREPRSVQELLALYGGLLAQGTELTVAEVALMMPDVPETAIHAALPLFEDSRVLRQANANVVELLFCMRRGQLRHGNLPSWMNTLREEGKRIPAPLSRRLTGTTQSSGVFPLSAPSLSGAWKTY